MVLRVKAIEADQIGVVGEGIEADEYRMNQELTGRLQNQFGSDVVIWWGEDPPLLSSVEESAYRSAVASIVDDPSFYFRTPSDAWLAVCQWIAAGVVMIGAGQSFSDGSKLSSDQVRLVGLIVRSRHDYLDQFSMARLVVPVV